MIDEPHIRAAISKLRRGDKTGLGMLVEVYQIKALRAVFLILQDRPTAEDIVQTAFVHAYERLTRAEVTAPFRVWFLRGLVDDALTRARKISTPSASNLTIPPQVRKIVEALRADESIPIEGENPQALLQQALAILTPDERANIVLRHYLGLSEADLAIPLEDTTAPRPNSSRKRFSELIPLFRAKPNTGEE